MALRLGPGNRGRRCGFTGPCKRPRPQATSTPMAARVGVLLCLALLAAINAPIAHGQEATPEQDLKKISHIFVLYLENRSFDNLMGDFPGANGIARARSIRQRDQSGQPYDTLPPGTGPFDLPGNPQALRQLKMGALPNEPF